MKVRILDPEEAASLVFDGARVCIGGGGAGHAVPDRLLQAIGERFRSSGSPKGLSVFHACGLGDAADRGLSHLAQPGLIRRAIGGFWGNSLKMVALAQADQLEAYNFPQGVLSHLVRASAGGRPGVICKTGLHTFVDPRVEGGKLNQSAREDLVQLAVINGDEFLFYPSQTFDIGLIRGTTLDREGNLSMEDEVGTFAMLSIAQAVKRNRGTVIAQVRSIRPEANTPPVHVKVPAPFIDAAVLEPDQGMTFLSPSEPALISRSAPAVGEDFALAGIPRVIAKRAAHELRNGDFVNVGFGLADGVPIVARQEGITDSLVFMIEQGAIGGIPTTGLNFGAMYNPLAIIDDGYQFDYFHGGGLDIAFLGFAQVDRQGNVNASRFGSRLTGCGGFIDISQHARRVAFCGTFAVKADSRVEDGRLVVDEPGRLRKFVEQVQQVTFSGSYAARRRQEVLYITERAVFRLTEEGLLLEEIAPGTDLQRDVLEMMDFTPLVPNPPRLMDALLFSDKLLGLKERFRVG